MSVKLSKFRVDDTMIEIDVPNGSVTEEKLSPEVAEKLNSGGESGGGVEFNSLDVTVSYFGENHTFTGFITSEIPENTVINDIIKIEHIDVQGSGQNAITNIVPLPTLTGRSDLSNNFTLKGYETFSQMSPTPQGMDIPLGIVFVKMDFDTDLTELTVNYKITYV